MLLLLSLVREVWSCRRDSVSGEEWQWGLADAITALSPPVVARVCMLAAAVTAAVCSATMMMHSAKLSLCPTTTTRWSVVRFCQLSALQCVCLLYVLLGWSLCLHLEYVIESQSDSSVTLCSSWLLDLVSWLLACILCAYFVRAVQCSSNDAALGGQRGEGQAAAAESSSSAARAHIGRDVAYAQLVALPSDPDLAAHDSGAQAADSDSALTPGVC